MVSKARGEGREKPSIITELKKILEELAKKVSTLSNQKNLFSFHP